jgi:hypothetical protein
MFRAMRVEFVHERPAWLVGVACRGAVTRPDQSSVRCPGSALVSSLQPVRVWRNPGVQTGRRRPRNGLAVAFAAPCNRLLAHRKRGASTRPGERANGLLIIVRMLPTIALGTLEDKSAGPSQATSRIPRTGTRESSLVMQQYPS